MTRDKSCLSRPSIQRLPPCFSYFRIFFHIFSKNRVFLIIRASHILISRYCSIRKAGENSLHFIPKLLQTDETSFLNQPVRFLSVVFGCPSWDQQISSRISLLMIGYYCFSIQQTSRGRTILRGISLQYQIAEIPPPF